MSSRATRPRVVAITNESPDWPAVDKYYADALWDLLIKSLQQLGYDFRAHKFFDDLSFLADLDPSEWIVINWGEEWAGKPWSDAEVADEIERHGLAYTGSAPAALRLTQNRAHVKELLRGAGIPTLPWRVYTESAAATDWTTFPAIVKGANQHASVGIDGGAIVTSAEQLAARIAYVRDEHADAALVEPFLDTREFQVAVWGNDPPEALPPAEFDYSVFDDVRDRLYTHTTKFDRQSSEFQKLRLVCPAPYDRPDWGARLERLAVDTYRLFGLRDYARFDLRMLGDEPQVLDVNANPDVDPISVIVAATRARGLTYGQMVDRMIQFAAARRPA